jgi:hypothetical protein
LLRRKYPRSLIWSNKTAPPVSIIAGYLLPNRRTAMEHNPALATSDEIAAAYLEWLDAAALDTSREAALLTALRAQSECVHALEAVIEMQIH